MALEEVAICGLYCGICSARRRIPRQAAALRDLLHAEGYDWWYRFVPGVAESFPAFWGELTRLAETPCPGCRAGGGDPGCRVRNCAGERGVATCPECDDFPCSVLDMLSHYPTLRTDGLRMREIGMERWIEEQEKRAATGFAYVDIRIPRPPPE